MPTDDERQRLRDAMDRLLAGAPIRSDGALTVVSLAAEAGLKRHLLTHRHTDLKDEFYAKVRSQGRVPKSELDLRDRVGELEVKLGELRTVRDGLLAQCAVLRRINNVLALENQLQRDMLAAHPPATPIRSPLVERI